MASARERLRRLVPWVVGLGLLGYLLYPYRLEAQRTVLANAFRRAPGWAALVAIAGALVAYPADTLATWLVLGWARVRMRFREVAVIRGVTYFLAMVNYSLGQAAMVLVLKRHGVRALRATGIILFIMGINVLVLLGFAGVSVAAGAAAPRALRLVIWALCATLPVYAGIILARPSWLAGNPVFEPLFQIGLYGHGKAMLARVPHIGCMTLAHWAMMRCFAIHTPLVVAALYLPIVFAVAVMPISPQGIGTSQLLAIQFFARYAPGDADAKQAAVLAYSLYLIVMWIPTQIVIGALSLRTEFGRSIRRAAAEEPPLTPVKATDILK
jgi:hypothetical protein